MDYIYEGTYIHQFQSEQSYSNTIHFPLIDFILIHFLSLPKPVYFHCCPKNLNFYNEIPEVSFL